MEINKIIEQLSMTSCDCHCGYGEEKTTVECTQNCEYCKAVKAAIEAMRKYQKMQEYLDKIRAEIIEEKECAYADFERYKVEYLGQDWEYVYDSLPQDDFRNGMERAIEIIDEYRQEK